MGALAVVFGLMLAAGGWYAKMHVITASMDSTMGRPGRMMPWMPFSP